MPSLELFSSTAEMQEPVNNTTLPTYFPTHCEHFLVLHLDGPVTWLPQCSILFDTSTLNTKRGLSSGRADNPVSESRILLRCLGLATDLACWCLPQRVFCAESVVGEYSPSLKVLLFLHVNPELSEGGIGEIIDTIFW